MILLLAIGCVEYAINTPVESSLGADDITDTAILSNGDTSASEDTGNLVDTSVTGPIASAPVYANTSGRLYEVEPSTGEAITIGDFRDDSGKVDGFVDIAIDLSGRMFGGTFESIYRIDPDTAEVDRLCDTEVELYAMTFTSDGRLIAGGPDSLTVIDVDDNCSTNALIENPMFETSGDLVGLPDGYLYWTVIGEDSDQLVRLDPNSGMFAPVGSLGYEQLYGLGYDEGELFGFSASGQIVAIAPDSAVTTLRSSGSLSWWGATTNPVSW